MKKINPFVIVITLFMFNQLSYSQIIDEPYEVGTWQGFRTAAVSYTFDDGSPNQFAVAVPMFDEFDFKLTLFTITGSIDYWLPDWTALQSAASSGHEVASHSVTHSHLNQMSDSLQNVELRDSQDAINANITCQKCITFAYPYCETWKRSLCEQYYIAARRCSNQITPSTPTDFFLIGSIICGPNGPLKTTQDFISKFESTANSKGWCVLLLHGVDNDGGWSSLSSTILRETLAYLDSNRTTYWVSSFGNVVRYIMERNAVSVTELSLDDNSITLQVTDTLDSAIYNYPVTLRRPLPNGWADASVSQNGQAVDAQVVEVSQTEYIMFDVVPDSGDIVITKTASTDVQQHGNLRFLLPTSSQNYPNPFNPVTTIEFTLPMREKVRLTLVNSLGQVVKELASSDYPAGKHQITLDASDLSSGIYFYRLQAGSFVDVKKLIVTR